MKKVALNALILTPRLGGVGVYMRELIKRMPARNWNWEPRIFTSAGIECPAKHFIVPVHIGSLNPMIRILSESMLWPRLLKKHQIDLFHSPISYVPPGVTCPAIVTVHDLRYFHYPETYTRLRGRFLERIIPKSVQEAVKILAVSDATRNDIINTLNINPDKVLVVHEGVDAERFRKAYSPQQWRQIKAQYRLPEKYILSAGHLEPRKNYERLFEAMAVLRRKYGLRVPLVVVGQENWGVSAIYDRVRSLNLLDAIHFTGFVNEAHLPALYQRAELFVAPSLFEGFGFTPLESMAAGTPVVASDRTSHPEILGNAALYFDPYDPEDIAVKIKEMLMHDELRVSFVEKGRERVKKFSWQSCCQQTFQVYEQVLAQL